MYELDTELTQEKMGLVEKLGVFLEQDTHMAPMTARVFSFITLSGRDGVTFDDLVDSLQASKSTVSTSLTHLQDLNMIGYYTRTGDRRKHFIVNADAFFQALDEKISKWKRQRGIHSDILKFKKKVNEQVGENPYFNLAFHEQHITFLDNIIILTRDLRLRTEDNIKGNNQSRI